MRSKGREREKEAEPSRLFIHKSIREFITVEDRFRCIMHPVPKEKVLPLQEWRKAVEDYFAVKKVLSGGKLLLTDEVREILESCRAEKGHPKAEVPVQEEEETESEESV